MHPVIILRAMVVVFSTSLIAQDARPAMLHNDGGTYLNDNPAPASTAILPDSVVVTLKGHSARIEMEGSALQIGSETVVRFEGNLVRLMHGTLQVDTTRTMAVQVGCLRVFPATSGPTRYDVTDVDGKVSVAAYGGEVAMNYRGGPRGAKKGAPSDVSIHQGEQVTREEKCGAAARPVQYAAARGAVLNSRYAVAGGSVAIGLTCWMICRPTDEPISPAKP